MRDPGPLLRLLTSVPADPEVHLWTLIALTGTGCSMFGCKRPKSFALVRVATYFSVPFW